jgi:hypothetical protein
MSDTRKWRENNVRDNDDTIWDKEADPVIMGALVKIEHQVGPNESTLYTVKKDDGELVKIWGSTVLDDRFLGLPEGSYVKVSYEGLKKGKNGKSYHNYKVFVDDEAEITKPEPELTNEDAPLDPEDIPF